jgi:hypothetical protein
VSAAFVGGFAVGHGTDHRDLVGDFGEVFEILAEFFSLDGGVDRSEWTAVFGGSVWLGIEGFLMCHSPWEENVNNRFRDTFFGFVKLLSALRLHFQELWKGQSEAAKKADIEKLALGIITGQWVAGAGMIFNGNSKR